MLTHREMSRISNKDFRAYNFLLPNPTFLFLTQLPYLTQPLGQALLAILDMYERNARKASTTIL